MQENKNSEQKILFVNHAAVLGGAELCLSDLAIAYRDSSQVLLFSEGPFYDRLRLQSINVSVIQAPKALLSVNTSSRLSSLTALPALWWMAKTIVQQSQGFDVIHANSQKAFAAAALARWMGGPPVVWHLRDIIIAGHFSRLNRWLAISLANAQASKVFVNSKATGDAFVAAGGRTDLVKLVYDGVSKKPFEQIQKEQSAAIRAEINVSSETPLVGCFSRLSYWKGQHVLLEAIREIPGVHAMLVGNALFGEEAYVNRLKALACSPELSGRVHWMGFRDDIPVLMAACNIIVHTSTEPEPFGRVIVEGQLAQRPVIATNAGGAQELVEHQKTGWLVPANSPKSLAEAIRELLESPRHMSDIIHCGYEVASSKFSLDVHLQNFGEAMAEVTA